MDALWIDPDIAEERDRNGAGCPACGRPTCTIGVFPCCHNSRRVTSDGQHVPDWELGHYIDLFAHGYGMKQIPWQEALARYGMRALIALHYLAVRWWPTTVSVQAAADNVERVCGRFWVTSCVHDGAPGKPCDWCQSLLDELERRGYSVWAQPRRLSGTGGLRAGEEITLCVDSTHGPRIATEQMVVHGGVPVWRVFDVIRPTGGRSYFLRGVFATWDSATTEARCRSISELASSGKSGYKLANDEAHLLAVSHLRGARCSCGLYGAYQLSADLLSTVSASSFIEPVKIVRHGGSELGVRVSMFIALARALAHGVVNIGINGVRASNMSLLRVYIPVLLPPEPSWAVPVMVAVPGSHGTWSRAKITTSRTWILQVAERVRAGIERRYKVPVTTVPIPLDTILTERRVIEAFRDEDAGNVGVWFGITDEAVRGLVARIAPYEDDPWDRDPARERLLVRRWGHVVEMSS